MSVKDLCIPGHEEGIKSIYSTLVVEVPCAQHKTTLELPSTTHESAPVAVLSDYEPEIDLFLET